MKKMTQQNKIFSRLKEISLLFSFIVFCFFTLNGCGSNFLQAEETEIQDDLTEINYVTFDEINYLIKKEPRNLVVIFHRQGCDFCGKMKEETLTDSLVVQMINSNYYAILFDALSNEEVVLNGNKYVNPSVENYSYHQLHQNFVDPYQESYYWPSIVFFDYNLDKIVSYPGFQPKDRFVKILDRHKK